MVNREADEDKRFEGNSKNDQALDKETYLILGAWKGPSPGFPTTDRFWCIRGNFNSKWAF